MRYFWKREILEKGKIGEEGMYEELASVYDKFMEEVPYQTWYAHIQNVWETHGQTPSSILDLGCGTGEMSLLFAKEGKQIIGVDISVDMLAQAQKRIDEQNIQNIQLIAQDMTELSVGMEFDCVVSCCDCLNYLLEEEELQKTFQNVYEHLKQDGLFLFDMNTTYYFAEVLGENTYCDEEDKAFYVWENSYDEAEKINTYYVNLFMQTEEGLYERFEECHEERAYEKAEVLRYLEGVGFEICGVYDGYTKGEAKEETKRYFYVVRKR